MIGEVLRQARELKGWSQTETAKMADVSQSYYADVERGRYYPSVYLLSRLGVLLEIDLNFLKENDGKTPLSKRGCRNNKAVTT